MLAGHLGIEIDCECLAKMNPRPLAGGGAGAASPTSPGPPRYPS